MAVRDPFAVLGLPVDADDRAVRDAYVAGVRAHPPDADPAAFQRVREAYEALRDKRARARWRLFGPPPAARMEDIVGDREACKRFVGPDAWLAVLGWRKASGAPEDKA